MMPTIYLPSIETSIKKTCCVRQAFAVNVRAIIYVWLYALYQFKYPFKYPFCITALCEFDIPRKILKVV
jgi:hypothetical protein